jgi:hypothetical protein
MRFWVPGALPRELVCWAPSGPEEEPPEGSQRNAFAFPTAWRGYRDHRIQLARLKRQIARESKSVETVADGVPTASDMVRRLDRLEAKVDRLIKALPRKTIPEAQTQQSCQARLVEGHRRRAEASPEASLASRAALAQGQQGRRDRQGGRGAPRQTRIHPGQRRGWGAGGGLTSAAPWERMGPVGVRLCGPAGWSPRPDEVRGLWGFHCASPDWREPLPGPRTLRASCGLPRRWSARSPRTNGRPHGTARASRHR